MAKQGMAQVLQADVNMQHEIDRLRAENARLREARTPGLSCKVTVARKPGTNSKDDKGSDGGAVSIYGLGRFPVTLYKGQWERLLGFAGELQAFIKAHESELSVKE